MTVIDTFYFSTVALAAVIPKLDLFMSLVGAVSSSFLALIFPPVLELITFWPKASNWIVAKDIAIILFGLTGFGTGTYASLEAIISAFSKKEWWDLLVQVSDWHCQSIIFYWTSIEK